MKTPPLQANEAMLTGLLQQLQSKPLQGDNAALDLDPEHPEQGLAKVVLTLLELLRELLERQAIRRMEGGSLSDEEIDRLGEAFARMQAKLAEVREVFGLREEDLNLDLGALGRLR